MQFDNSDPNYGVAETKKEAELKMFTVLEVAERLGISNHLVMSLNKNLRLPK